MKSRLYICLSVIMLLITACSDNDAKDDPVPEPIFKKGYVSRIKVTDLNKPDSETKTIKIYYDSQRRVTGVHWGTTVPGRTAWKFVYGPDKTDFIYSGDTDDTRRYCSIDGDAKALNMFYESPGYSSRTVYSYADDRLQNLTEICSDNSKRNISADFSWNMYGITNVTSVTKYNGKDSIKVSSSVLYDEFAANNTNIDLNVIVDAVNGIIPEYDNAPMLLGICGRKSPQLVLRHSQLKETAGVPSGSETRGYNVLTYSIQQGRLEKIETASADNGRQLRIDIIYKAD